MKIGIFGLVMVCFLVACNEKQDKILVFSKTEGFRHSSIPAGIAAIQAMGAANGYTVDATEDAQLFEQNNLEQYAAVIFLSTTGDVLNDDQQVAFQRYIQAGGGYVGIHAAADTEYDWPWYGGLVGAYFQSHPNNPNVRDAVINKTEHSHPSTDHLADKWDRTDEWYNYRSISANITTLLNLDETTYEGGTNGEHHPIAWYHEYDGGRAFYTGGGHTDESFQESAFVEHLSKAIDWVMESGRKLDYTKSTVMPEPNRFVLDVYDSFFNEPMEMELLPDGRIVIVERKGDVKLYTPKTGKTEKIAHIDVHTVHEDGLMGIALDPNYAQNKYAYICYSDPKESHQNISRFVFDPDAEKVLSDEKVVLTVPVQRDECCHSAGSVEFDAKGFLYVSFGDNTNPFHSEGTAPIDERAGKSPFDAQKSSANMNDLRGKIIRIKVNEDASYSIPDGNLFAKDGSQGRPEIYVMGCRNPFRFSIDPKNGYVYWGDVGPDARDDNPTRGPKGHDEVNQAKKPGFFGWPYFIGNNKPYYDFDFATEKSGALFDPRAPVNNSPNNTGLKNLPPAQPAMIYYPYGKSEEFPLVKTGGRNAMAGPIYYSDLYEGKKDAFPEYYDGKLFTYEWMRGWIMAVSFDSNGDMTHMEPFAPQYKWSNLIDVILTPEGDLLLLEYGAGWFTANKDARLSRLKYVAGNRQPTASFSIDKTAGGLPLTVSVDASQSKDNDGDVLTYEWNFGDGQKGNGKQTEHTYQKPGDYTIILKVTDPDGQTSTSQSKVLAGNEPPVVDIVIKGNSQFFWPGIPLTYEVTGKDLEDGNISADQLNLTVDYLERGYDITTIAQGHQALAELNRKHPGLELIEGNDCASCHKLDGPSIGPSYQNVADKYKSKRSAAIADLAGKIINGGGGVWGETAMAAHPDLTLKDATVMAEYIMSLAEKKVDIQIPSHGSYTFDVPKDKKSGGTWVMLASYTDRGATGSTPIRSFKNVLLRSPFISAADFHAIDGSTKFTITPELSPTVKEPMDVVIAMDNGTVSYEGIDLSDIGTITITAMAPAAFVGGGVLELHLDKVSDRPIAQANININAKQEPDNYTLILPAQEGKHTLILRSVSADPSKPVGIIVGMTVQPSLQKDSM